MHAVALVAGNVVTTTILTTSILSYHVPHSVAWTRARRRSSSGSGIRAWGHVPTLSRASHAVLWGTRRDLLCAAAITWAHSGG